MKMVDIKVNAELFRLAFECVSTEETRYYLNGVYVEPRAEGGAYLVATDGHRLIVILDEHGSASEAAIVKLSPATLKLCKPAKPDLTRRLEVAGQEAKIIAISAPPSTLEEPVGIQAGVLIDGTFPDWRRVIPPDEPVKAKAEAKATSGLLPAFNPEYFTSMSRIGAGLAKAAGGIVATIKIVPRGASDPALVLWPSFPLAFGLLMPIRHSMPDALPTWLTTPAGQSKAA
jgi:hypothetical protein